MLLSIATGSGAQSPLKCREDDPYCAAANLSTLYSDGAAIATSICAVRDDDCQNRRSSALSAAAEQFRKYLRSLRVRRLDPTFAGNFGEPPRKVTVFEVKSFVRARMTDLSRQCRLSTTNCIRARIYLLADLDQAVRLHPNCSAGGPSPEHCRLGKQAEMKRVDLVSTGTISEILSGYGWPATATWGRATDDEFWLLVQHADADPALQKRALEALKQAGDSASSMQHMAYLEDRIRVHEKQPQLYGTQGQCRTENGKHLWRPDPIENEAHLDQRRAAIGMSSIADYAKEAAEACERF